MQRSTSQQMCSFTTYRSASVEALESLDAAVLERVVDVMLDACAAQARVFVCGNGGSASNANHFAQDLTNLTLRAGRVLRVTSLCNDTSMLTATANDYGYERVFARQLEMYSSRGDVLVCISGSGKSRNVVEATEWSKLHGLTTIAFLGYDGGTLKDLAEITVLVQSFNMGLLEGIHALALDYVAQECRNRLRAVP